MYSIKKHLISNHFTRFFLLLVFSAFVITVTGCPSYHDLGTCLCGNAYYDGNLLLGADVYCSSEEIQNADRPYIIINWSTSKSSNMDFCCGTSASFDISFDIVNFVEDNKKTDIRYNQALMDDSVLSFTYVPESGDSITVTSSGAEWQRDENNWYYFTVDFDTRTFTAGELK